MRTIKFRGNCVGNGDMVYGDLEHLGDEIYIGDWEVKPESVAQLVGLDEEAREVYEGDLVMVGGAFVRAKIFPVPNGRMRLVEVNSNAND